MTKSRQPITPPPRSIPARTSRRRAADAPAPPRAAESRTAGDSLLGVDEVAEREQQRLERAQNKDRHEAVDGVERDGDAPKGFVGPEGSAAHAIPPGEQVNAVGVLLVSQGLQPHPVSSNEEEAGEEEETPLPSPEEIIAAAHRRIDRHGRYYGRAAAWKSPNPRVPGNSRPDAISFGGTVGHDKSNYFCLDVLYEAGFEVPSVESGEDAGWYPVAADLQLFARGYNRIFNGVMSLELDRSTRRQRRPRLSKLLRLARTGDILVVRFGSADDFDSYHCRLVLENRFEEEQHLVCAAAARDQARIVASEVNELVEAMGAALLRPIRALGSESASEYRIGAPIAP